MWSRLFHRSPWPKSLINGKLHALDVNEEMVAACEKRVRQARMGNVEVQKCGDFDFPIEPGSLDGAFLAFVVHHTEDKGRFLNAVRGLMQPKGWCSILEMVPEGHRVGTAFRAAYRPWRIGRNGPRRRVPHNGLAVLERRTLHDDAAQSLIYPVRQ